MAKGKKRSDGLYQKSIAVARKGDGTLIRKVVYGKTKKELEDKVAELTTELNSGIDVCENSITFKELAYIWFEQYNPVASEHWKYENEMHLKNHLFPYIGDIRIRDLKQIHLQMILGKMAKENYSHKTVKTIKQIAVRVMKVAVDSDLLLKNPFTGVNAFGKAPEIRMPITPEQQKLVTENWRGHRMGLPAMIMLYAGLRRGEMLALNWEDIDFEKKVITVSKALCILSNRSYIKEPKTKAGVRQVPIPDILLDALKEVRRDKGPVFSTVKVEEISDMSYRRAWESYMSFLNVCAGGVRGKSKACKTVWVIDKFTAHMLRHTYATMLFDANVDVKSAQKFLGHANVEITLSIYTHLSKYKEDMAIAALNEHLSKMGKAG